MAMKQGNPYNDSLLSYAYAGKSPLVHSKSKALYSFARTDRFVPMKSFSPNKFYIGNDNTKSIAHAANKNDKTKGAYIGYGPKITKDFLYKQLL